MPGILNFCFIIAKFIGFEIFMDFVNWCGQTCFVWESENVN